MSERGARRRGRWRTRVALVLAIALAGFAVGEAWVRARVGAPLPERLPLMAVRANKLRGYEMVEGLHYTYEHPVHVNALGLRGPELAPKRADEPRVLALGDSLVYGQGVGDDGTLPSFLERALRRQDPERRPWTVVNGGHRGYDTNQELALLEELGGAIEPDVVVLFWFWNDFLERPVAQSYAKLASRGPVVFDTGDRLEDHELWKWRLRQLVRRSALVMLLHDRIGAVAQESFDPAFVERGFARLRHYLERFEALAARQGFRPVVAILPDPNRLLRPSFAEALDHRAAALARETGLPVIEPVDPVRRLAAERRRLPVVPYDGHYDAEGNEAMAELAASELLRLVDARD